MLFIIRIGLSGLVLALSVRTASALPQGTGSERRVWPPVSESGAFSGEIEYTFDTALNKTRARFETSLASRNVLLRVLVGEPTVHTLIAVYDFRGRILPNHPDSVRVSLISDEVRQAALGYFPSLGAEPILLVSIGDTVVRYPLGIAQRAEELIAPDLASPISRSSRGDEPTRYFQRPTHEVHIERTATAWIPICDFLALVYARNVHGTVAGLDFDLNESVISGLRQFAAEMNPSAAVRDGVSCR
jgi:hypothetical protein